MPEGQQRDVRERFVRNTLPVCPETLDDVIDLDGVPVEDRIRDQAQAADLIHNFLVILCNELPLICKEHPSWQLMAVSSFTGRSGVLLKRILKMPCINLPATSCCLWSEPTNRRFSARS